jgi:hypothetical protein
MDSKFVKHQLKEAVRYGEMSASKRQTAAVSQEIERFAVGDFLEAVLHTIVFHRAMGVVNPHEVSISMARAEN